MFELPIPSCSEAHLGLLGFVVHCALCAQSIRVIHAIQHSKLRRLPHRHLATGSAYDGRQEEYRYRNEQTSRTGKERIPNMYEEHVADRSSVHGNAIIGGPETRWAIRLVRAKGWDRTHALVRPVAMFDKRLSKALMPISVLSEHTKGSVPITSETKLDANMEPYR